MPKFGLERFISPDTTPEPNLWMRSAFDVGTAGTVQVWIDAGAKAGITDLWAATWKKAFQQAVEERALWLFEQFWKNAGFPKWLPDESRS